MTDQRRIDSGEILDEYARFAQAVAVDGIEGDAAALRLFRQDVALRAVFDDEWIRQMPRRTCKLANGSGDAIALERRACKVAAVARVVVALEQHLEPSAGHERERVGPKLSARQIEPSDRRPLSAEQSFRRRVQAPGAPTRVEHAPRDRAGDAAQRAAAREPRCPPRIDGDTGATRRRDLLAGDAGARTAHGVRGQRDRERDDAAERARI